MSQNFCVFHASNLSVQTFEFFLLMYPGQSISSIQRAERWGRLGKPVANQRLWQSCYNDDDWVHSSHLGESRRILWTVLVSYQRNQNTDAIHANISGSIVLVISHEYESLKQKTFSYYKLFFILMLSVNSGLQRIRQQYAYIMHHTNVLFTCLFVLTTYVITYVFNYNLVWFRHSDVAGATRVTRCVMTTCIRGLLITPCSSTWNGAWSTCTGTRNSG